MQTIPLFPMSTRWNHDMNHSTLQCPNPGWAPFLTRLSRTFFSLTLTKNVPCCLCPLLCSASLTSLACAELCFSCLSDPDISSGHQLMLRAAFALQSEHSGPRFGFLRFVFETNHLRTEPARSYTNSNASLLRVGVLKVHTGAF